MTRLAEDGNLIEIKTIRIELHIFETFEPVRPHGWLRMRRMAGMAAEAVTHSRFNECEPKWGVCSFPQPRGNDPTGENETRNQRPDMSRPFGRRVEACVRCSGVRRSYAAAGRVAIERLRPPFGTRLEIREFGVPAYFVGLAKFV